MSTLSETLASLKEQGYNEDFNLVSTHLSCTGKAIDLFPDEFVVDQYFRFEGPSDPADEAVVYAISSVNYNLRGTLVNGYGTSSEALASEMVQALRVHPV